MSEMLVVAVVAPEVPVTVIVTAEDVTCAEAPAVNVSTCVPGEEPAAKEAITLVGSPVATSETVPEKPPTSVTVIVVVSLPPCATESVAGAADNVKLCTAFTATVVVPLTAS